MSIPLIDRLQRLLKVMPNGCWEFQGYCRKGYGQIRRGKAVEGNVSVHRAMWEIVFDIIPDGICVLHHCDNPPCANPAHLFLGTKANNTDDMMSKGRGKYITKMGEENGQSKLNWEQVHAIRVDGRSNTEIGKDYGIHNSNVSRIKSGERWKKNDDSVL